MFGQKKFIPEEAVLKDMLISEWDILPAIEKWHLSFHIGTALIYMVRSTFSSPMQQLSDLKISKIYLEHFIERLEKELGHAHEGVSLNPDNLNSVI